jgi:hypothetical protein
LHNALATYIDLLKLILLVTIKSRRKFLKSALQLASEMGEGEGNVASRQGKGGLIRLLSIAASITLSVLLLSTGAFGSSLWDNTVTPTVLADSDTSAVELGVKFQSSVSGVVTALRFYKSPTNTGTHVGNLWTAGGTLLASVTFTNETASGWQQMPLPTPVPITANTTYVASYHTNVGRYSANSAYFNSAYVNSHLRAPATGESGGNGVYRYGASAFPNQTYNATNYWVDVVFEGQSSAGPEPAGWFAGDMHVHRSCGGAPIDLPAMYANMGAQNLAVISLLADMGNGEVQDPGLDLPRVNGQDDSVSTPGRIVHWDAEWHWDATYTQFPHQALGGHVVALGLTEAHQIWEEYTYPIFQWARQQNGIAGFAHMQYLDDSIPQSLDCCKPIEYPVEVALGAADFISEDVGGSDSFIRAYYRLLNTGFRPGFAAGSDFPCNADVGSLLTYVQVAGGNLTYRNWIEGIANGRTVISRNGHNEFLNLTVNNSATPGDEINLTAGGSVPVTMVWTANQSLTGTIELVKNGAIVASVQRTVSAGAPASFSTTVDFTKSGWLAARRMDANGHQVHTAAVFVTVNGAPVRASAADAEFYVQWMDNLLAKTSPGGEWNSFFPTRLAQAQARYQQARAVFQQIALEAAGNETPPTVVSVSPNSGATGVSTGTAVAATFSEPMNAASINSTTFVLRDASNAIVPSAVAYNSGTNTATLSPSAALTAGTTYSVRVSGGTNGVQDAAGTPLASDYTWTFTTASGGTSTTYSVWNNSAVPAILADTDTAAVELGMKFQSSVAGYIAGIKFYKGTGNAGTHVGNLWTSAGVKLGSVTFTGETTSGWQYQAFASPVAISANTTYVVSYHAPVGRYSANVGYFTSGVGNYPLRALSSSESGGNGVYRYGASAFPNLTWNSANYWVDVVFQQTPGSDTTPPVVTSASPSAGSTNVSPAATVNATFSEPMNAASINTTTFELRNSANILVASTVAYNSSTNTAVLTPLAALAAGATYTARVLGGAGGVADLAGNRLAASYSWSFTTAAASDTTPPTVISTIPSVGGTGINVNTQVSAVFSESVNAATVNGTTFELRNSANVLVTAAVAYNTTTQTAVLTTGNALSSATLYTATVKGGTGGVLDAAGNPMAADFVWTFTTAAGTGDTTPPTVSAVYPLGGATGVGTDASVQVTFSENMNAATITTSTFLLRDSLNSQVPAAVTYNSANRTAILSPSSALEAGKTYTATVVGGAGGVADVAGNRLSVNFSWSFSTSSASPNGSGGPILVVASAANPFSRYLAEILTAEGMNAFSVLDISTVTDTVLAGYDVVVLGQIALTTSQVTMFTSWVTAGGNLIAMRPDKKLAGLLGLTDAGTTLSEGYLLVNTASGPGKGIVGQTIQYHGTADRYTMNGATSVASLYTNATTATSSPAVSLRSVGTNGGQAAAFTYDLARSVVYTRQGNPAWAGQERDGLSPLRSNDLFYPDWVDLNKVAIPQADEQQRLFANLILQMNFDKKPLPRFWYFPDGYEAAVVMTGDDHGQDGTAGRFEQYIASSPVGCSVDDWECIRSSSYIYPDPVGAVTNAQAAAYNAAGFEIGLHVNTGCADYTRQQLEDYFDTQMAEFRAIWPSLPAVVSHRAHCIAWSGYTTMAEVEAMHGIRMDVTYYYWPGSWVANRPGFFTGSGMPMRFATAAGEIIDVYQAATQMTDESGQTYPYTIDALLDKAIGPEGYYGAFTANIHTDSSGSPYSDAIINSALNRGIPVISARQLLKWVDGRNGSSFSSFSATGSTVSFSVTVGQGANGLEAMVPKPSGKSISGIRRDGVTVGYVSKVVKGQDYAVFAAVAGNYVVTFTGDTQPPTVFSKSPLEGAVNVSTATDVRVSFSEAMDPASINGATFELRGPGSTLVPAVVTYDSATNTAVLTPSGALAAGTAYTAIVFGGSNGVKDAGGNPMTSNNTWSFTTAPAGGGSQSYSIWGSSAVPAVAAANDPSAVELGVKFRSSVSGYIMGLRFYKGTGNTGTHVGSLWNSSGTKLAGVTFTNETASGWQYQAFAAPVVISAGTTYVASYHAPVGRYAIDVGYFSAGVDSSSLRALSNSESGGNGVYRYGASGFPNQTWDSANYWVDVVFQQSLGQDTTPPTITSVSPALGAANVSTGTKVTVIFNEAMEASTIDPSTFLLRDSNGVGVAASVVYESATRSAVLTPSGALAAGTTYTARILGTAVGVTDLAGNPLAADYFWSFTTSAGGVSQTYSLWDNTAVPAILADTDTNAVELGMKFRSSVPGFIRGIRFYKSASNTGTHVGNLWSSSGTNLASVTFTGETASGWQYQALTAPVAISANTTYVVSYHAPGGHYSANGGYFSAGLDRYPLRALSSSESGGNGVYRYGASGFPNLTYNLTNYWVDVVFQE